MAVSAVQFRSGLAMPLARIAALARRHGAEVAVDAIQALGVVPLDAPALGVDYVAGGAQKWLTAAPGAGYLWVKPGLAPSLWPTTAGWLSHEDAVRFLLGGTG